MTKNNVIKIAQKQQMDGNVLEEVSQLHQLAQKFVGTASWLMENNVMMRTEMIETDVLLDVSLKKDGLALLMEREQ